MGGARWLEWDWAAQQGVCFADLLQKKSIGAKEETGFTEESTKNPIVFQPPSQALPGDPVSQAGAHLNPRATSSFFKSVSCPTLCSNVR